MNIFISTANLLFVRRYEGTSNFPRKFFNQRYPIFSSGKIITILLRPSDGKYKGKITSLSDSNRTKIDCISSLYYLTNCTAPRGNEFVIEDRLVYLKIKLFFYVSTFKPGLFPIFCLRKLNAKHIYS